ncbi:MAG: 5-dehydro-2-deoxygluconokinase [Acidimicrobiales bacterium]
MTDLQLLTVGRVSVDLYAQQPNVSLNDVTSFQKSVGGTATNVAVAAARLGVRSAVATKVGDDAFGAYVRHALENTFAVDTRFVGIDPDLGTPLAFAELNPPGDPTIIFYREPKAPDMNIEVADFDLDVVRDVDVFWVPASRFHDEPSATTVRVLLEERRRREHTVLDLDWRPMFWESMSQARSAVEPMLQHATIAIGNRTECEMAVGEIDPDRAADALLEHGLSAAIVKLGEQGVLLATADGQRESIPPYRVEVVCGLGAGDAFGGAFVHALICGMALSEAVKRGNAAGAIVAGRMMCADDMPTNQDMDEFLENR